MTGYITPYAADVYLFFCTPFESLAILPTWARGYFNVQQFPEVTPLAADKTTSTFYGIELHRSAGSFEGKTVYCVSEDEANSFSVGDSSPKFRSRKEQQYRVPGTEIIIVDCSKMPLHIDDLKDYLERFIVPD